MIIFGTRGIRTTMEEGEFLCPQCATNKRYKHKKVTNFFTLYFIPLIPLGRAGDYVECQTCEGTFVSRVLDYNPQLAGDNFQSEYEKAMRHSMVMMMLADGEIDDNEMLTVQRIINKFGHHDMSLDELEDYVDQVEDENEAVDTYLRRVTPNLNEHGKEIIIKCAITVAGADGHIDQSEIDMIKEMARAMDMSASHLKGILSDMSKSEPNASDN